MKIAVVGGGVFGCTSAIQLAELGHNVTLFDLNQSILMSASGINQYRLHRGYHYPRSNEMVNLTNDFENEYTDCIIKHNYKRYYAIAVSGSKTTPEQYISFLKQNKLEYKIVEPFVNASLMVQVNENSFDVGLLYLNVWKKLHKYDVKVKMNTKFTEENINDFDLTINATYSNLNDLIPVEEQRDYQFELCEKVIVKTPDKFKNKSLVIMDGEFCCIDPFGNSNHHSLLGHVKEALHDTFIGKQYKAQPAYKSVLNRGIIKYFHLSKHKQIMRSCAEHFQTKFDYVGSMYTVRTVLPNKEVDDARPTQLIKHNDKLISVFGGKIATSVNIVNELIKII